MWPSGSALTISPRRSYLGVILAALLAGCGPKPQPVAPLAFAPASREAFAQAAAATVPPQRLILRIGWKADDGRLELSGNGAVRIAPPDSLRLDVAAALGLGRSTMIMLGDVVTAQPANVVDQVLPDRFALWAAIGIMRIPPGRISIEHAADGVRTMWRTTDAAGRMTVFELTSGILQSVTRLEGERTMSQLRLDRNESGEVVRANLLDTGRGFRLQVDVNARETSGAFAPETWRLRS